MNDGGKLLNLFMVKIIVVKLAAVFKIKVNKPAGAELARLTPCVQGVVNRDCLLGSRSCK